jgi:hypothetical protein
METKKKVCEHCGKPGGRVQLDPYSQEINGEEIKMRLHRECVQRRIDDV